GRDADSENNDQGRNTNNRFYNQGLTQGQYDREHSRGHKYRSNPRDSDDRQAYRRGYDRGYTSYNAQNDPYPQNGQYGQYGQDRNVNNPGFSADSQYGITDGQNDRAAGRPWKYGPGYAKSDRGYSNSYGDKNAYRQQYQLGYQEGYQQAYSGRGYRANK